MSQHTPEQVEELAARMLATPDDLPSVNDCIEAAEHLAAYAATLRQQDGRVDERALHQIKHSIQQARIPGNDWKRELALIENTVDEAQAALAQSTHGEAVGEAGTMPGTTGFTMACFKASDVPAGTKLYTHAERASGEAVDELNFLRAQQQRVRQMLRTFNRHGDARIEWDVNDAVQECGELRHAVEAYEADAVAYRERIKELEAERARVPAETLQISSYLWCECCHAVTKHERRDPDVCCSECHYIAITEHGAPSKPAETGR